MKRAGNLKIGKHEIHYAWVILFACCMLFGAAMGIFSNCSSLYTADMLSEMGWSMTLLTAMGIGSTITRIIGSRMAPKIFRTFSMKAVLAVAMICMMGAAVLRSRVHDAVSYTLLLSVDGFAGAFIYYIPIPILINNWFAKKKDTALGIAMMCSGLMAAVASPVFAGIMEQSGWRTAMAVNSLTALAVALPAILLFVVRTPEEMGLKPYGWEPPAPMKVMTSPSQIFENGNPDYETGVSVKQKRILFLLSAILAMLLNGVSGIPTKLPHFAITSGLGASLGAVMLSFSQVGNMASKAVLGPLSDRFGPRKTYTVSAALVFLSCLVFLLKPSAAPVLLAAAFLSGLSAANNTMVYPAAVRTYSRGDEYAEYISRISIAFTFFGTPWNLLVSALFDVSGNYTSTFVLYTVSAGICALLTCRMFTGPTGTKT